LTTMGPRWSRETVEPPVLMSSWWVGFEGAAGRARGALGALLGVSGCSSAAAEGCEELFVKDIVNGRDLVMVVIGGRVLLMRVGA